ncbi:MAG: hypothetical protein QOI77_319 [Blastocatellia bacterium]|nr:hypothetical protein [Blastocatellia bacterium]
MKSSASESLGRCLRPANLKFVGHFAPTVYFFFVAAGEGFPTVAAGAATEAAGAGVGVFTAGVGVTNGACSGTPDCNTELVPVTIGNESINAKSMNDAAAPIVIFDNNVCVPLGPNAVLETELEKSAPASAFPGCSRTVTTRTMHARINNP